ncbi:TPA: hypothetical protein DEF17_08910 [bacterium]|nr:MAG: hypothetical protein AUJ18_04850 [Candidatus Hydrogenedentes bacterium CG1_02_42_14]PIU48040.1 MAG: hypothetical protein COS94_04225 [Candidatus Hydrogenedentes bacterium CG07_land_8_20_14_0_80_42_17]HBW48028.1 hypothetical protein [bacterium]
MIKNRNCKRSDSLGFTLIELLAVTAIIAILASIAVSKLYSAIDQAKISKAIAEITELHNTVEMYRVMNDGELPLQISDLIPQFYQSVPDDPWGTPYVYNNFTQIPPGQKRKDGPLVPINKEYDIFSNGPNKATTPNIRSTNGKDDIILANDGAFIDVAEKY